MLENIEVECFFGKAGEPYLSFWDLNYFIFFEEVAVLEGDILTYSKCQSDLIFLSKIVRQLIIVSKADDFDFPATFDNVSKEEECKICHDISLKHLKFD